MKKYIRTFENFNTTENKLSVGTKIKQDMGIGGKGTIIPWFNWKNATDGTYKQPDRDKYVAVKWDDGKIGFAPIAYLSIINSDGSEEQLGYLISDEEYDTTSDEFKIIMHSDNNRGTVEFEDGTVDNFIIYNTNKIAFDRWYPEEKYNSLVDAIKKNYKFL